MVRFDFKDKEHRRELGMYVAILITVGNFGNGLLNTSHNLGYWPYGVKTEVHRSIPATEDRQEPSSKDRRESSTGDVMQSLVGPIINAGAIVTLGILYFIGRRESKRSDGSLAIRQAGNWDWLINMARNELDGHSGVFAQIQRVELNEDNIAPYLEFTLSLCNTTVWPVLIVDKASGYIECGGQMLQGPPEVIGAGIIQHGQVTVLTIRQWLGLVPAAFLKGKTLVCSLGCVQITSRVNPNGLWGHPAGNDGRINTNMLRASVPF